jgi:thioredoxin reductase (NADPH)
MRTEAITIIGCGPAGIAAAIQLRRFGFEPRILERAEIGGLIRNARRIENYPGFPKGITGTKLVRLLRAHLDGKGPAERETVLNADYHNRLFLIKTDQRSFRSRILIIATGTEPEEIFDRGTRQALAGRIFYEPWTLPRSKDKRIAIIGAGDAAFDYALGLIPRHKVTIIGRRSKPQCLPVLWRLSRANPALKIFLNARVEGISVDDRSIILHLSGGKDWRADYILVACGRKPCLGFLGPGLRRRQPRLIADGKLWLIGDVKNERCRQVGISVGDGIRSAMEIADRFGDRMK